MPFRHSWRLTTCRPLLWPVLLALLAGEGLTFYLLCVPQMHRAEARRQVSQVESQAFSDCLVYVTGSTIASCRRHMVVRR